MILYVSRSSEPLLSQEMLDAAYEIESFDH